MEPDPSYSAPVQLIQSSERNGSYWTKPPVNGLDLGLTLLRTVLNGLVWPNKIGLTKIEPIGLMAGRLLSSSQFVGGGGVGGFFFFFEKKKES